MKQLLLLSAFIFMVNLSFSQEKQQTDSTKHHTFSVRLDPIRLFESSFAIHVEWQIRNVSSVELEPFVTYGTKSSSFVNNLYLSQLNIDNYTTYNNSTVMGGGIIASYKYYFNNYKNDVYGPYMSFFSMFRRTSINALKYTRVPYYENGYTYYKDVEDDITYNLNVFFNGVFIGYKEKMGKNFCYDIYIGGGLRLSKYDHQSITKYRGFGSFDYSGITPTFGLSIGFYK